MLSEFAGHLLHQLSQQLLGYIQGFPIILQLLKIITYLQALFKMGSLTVILAKQIVKNLIELFSKLILLCLNVSFVGINVILLLNRVIDLLNLFEVLKRA
jgi:hypothetical protein